MQILFSLLMALFAGHSQQTKPVALDVIPTVSYCELIRNPNLYAEKLVRVKATWEYGFEMSDLYDPECLGKDHAAWIEMADEDQLCAVAKKNLKKLKPEGFAKADVTVVGKIYAGRRYGHENGYDYKFVATCLEAVKRIPLDTP